MRSYAYLTDRQLDGSGHNLSGVLYNLCQKTSTKDHVLAFVRSLPEQNIDAIDFIKTPRGEVMLQLTETFGGEKTRYDATLLSDGTLRVLSIAAAILSAPEDSLVVIEEIDNGVHPSRAKHLIDDIARIAKKRRLRILISTHNPALADALPADAVPNVVLCYREPKDGDSRLARLEDIPDYPELSAQGTVGHLMSRGLIERFVKTHPGPEEKTRRALEWIEALERQVG